MNLGHTNTYAIKTDGTFLGWGVNDRGQLLDTTTTNRYTPVELLGLSNG